MIMDTEPVYASPPQQPTRTSASPVSSNNVEHQLIAGMNALQSQGSDCQPIYMPVQSQEGPIWSACVAAQAGGDDFENYALHSSPAASSLYQQAGSSQSSPRSWTSPEQFGPVSWDPAAEHLQHDQYHGLDPQLSGFQLRESVGYMPNNSNPAPTSVPTNGLPYAQSPSFSAFDAGYHSRSHSEQYQAGHHALSGNVGPSTPQSAHPLSPRTRLGRRPGEDMSTAFGAETGDCVASVSPSRQSSTDGHNRHQSSASTPADCGVPTSNAKNEPSYAKLLYRAFMSNPRHAMTLQEIYQWFRENTDRAKDDSKGWQNSIRHNLSMNVAFTRRERKTSSSKGGDAEDGSACSASDNRKSTEWYLEPWAIGGVQSTSRHRKDNQSRRSGASHGAGLSSRAYRSYARHGRGGNDFSSSRSRSGGSSSRKGGGILTGRIRARQPPPTSASQMNAYLFPSHHHGHHHHHHHQYHHNHHHHQQQPLLHGLLSDPPSSPYGTNFFQPGPSPTSPSHIDMCSISASASIGIDLDYDYPDPQLFPSSAIPTAAADYHHHHATTGGSMARAPPSESAADDPEPVTPEPAYGSEDAAAAMTTHHHNHQQQQQQLLLLHDVAGGWSWVQRQ
ncbi:hypothetical protein VTK56DRAFT_6109 [Thermocarpiscus australiensis]